nr:hypothetical protein [Tanacetum cinerariifolium]
DEPSVGKVDTMSGQWDDITMKKAAVKKSLSKLKAQSPLKPTPMKTPMIPKPFKKCKYCRFNDHHYDHLTKAFKVFNIRREELEETVHVTFSEDDEAISQSNTEGDAINFNGNRSFPDDEFLELKREVTQYLGNTKCFPYLFEYENTIPSESPILQVSIISEDPLKFTKADDHPALNEPDQTESASHFEPI